MTIHQEKVELTENKNEHASVTSTTICRTDTDQIAKCNWYTASDDESASSLVFIGKPDNYDERSGTDSINWDGHVVDFKGDKSRPNQRVV